MPGADLGSGGEYLDTRTPFEVSGGLVDSSTDAIVGASVDLGAASNGYLRRYLP